MLSLLVVLFQPLPRLLLLDVHHPILVLGKVEIIYVWDC